jgi:hypothetical protein
MRRGGFFHGVNARPNDAQTLRRRTTRYWLLAILLAISRQNTPTDLSRS